MAEEKRKPIRMSSTAFTNHMRRKADAFKPECVNLGPDFAVFEFPTGHDANQFVIECIDFNGLYQYEIKRCVGAKTQSSSNSNMVVIINPYTAEMEKATNG